MDASKVCDQTLLLYDYWRIKKFENSLDTPYIFSYFLGSRRYYGKALKILSDKHKNIIVSVPMNSFGVRHGDFVVYACGVEDFLNYIQNAEFVCVDSFHAVVFSVIYEKQFIVLNKYKEGDLSSQNSRITDFLEVLGLTDRIVSEKQLHWLQKLPLIDYQAVNDRLHRFIDDSNFFCWLH